MNLYNLQEKTKKSSKGMVHQSTGSKQKFTNANYKERSASALTM